MFMHEDGMPNFILNIALMQGNVHLNNNILSDMLWQYFRKTEYFNSLAKMMFYCNKEHLYEKK